MTSGVKRGLKAALAVAAMAASVAAPQGASAQLFLVDPVFQTGPIDGSDPLVGLPIAGASANEYRAHLLWNMRAGLNVAALQCQFSPLLRSVDNYNGILAHHSKELADAYSTLNAYFKRAQGNAKGQKAFDDYTTITYNNFSTLQAQYGFCQTAASIAKEALTRPKGELHLTAQARMRELRGSLVVPPYARLIVYNPHLIRMPALPPLDDKCYTKKNELRPRCAAAGYAAANR